MPLRDQLRSARSAYESMRHPGDLGALVEGQTLPDRQSRPRRIHSLLIAAGLAMAACVAVVVALQLRTTPNPTPITEVAANTSTTTDATTDTTTNTNDANVGANTDASVASAGAAEQFVLSPDGLDLSVPAMPSLISFGEYQLAQSAPASSSSTTTGDEALDPFTESFLPELN